MAVDALALSADKCDEAFYLLERRAQQARQSFSTHVCQLLLCCCCCSARPAKCDRRQHAGASGSTAGLL
jgi:hypothetical protein